MRKLLVTLIVIMSIAFQAQAFAAKLDTSEITFFLYNIADTNGESVSAVVEKLRSTDPKFDVNSSEARIEMFSKPVTPAPGEKLLAISGKGVFTDSVKSFKFNEMHSTGQTYLMFCTKRYPNLDGSGRDEGDIIFAMKKGADAQAIKRPMITEAIRCSKSEKNAMLEKAMAFISDPAKKESVFSLVNGFDEEKELSENLSAKYTIKSFRPNGRSEKHDISMIYLKPRSKENDYDDFMFIFDRGKLVFADHAEYKFSFKDDGIDYFLTKQWKPESGCIGLVLYAIINGSLEQVVSDYSFAD